MIITSLRRRARKAKKMPQGFQIDGMFNDKAFAAPKSQTATVLSTTTTTTVGGSGAPASEMGAVASGLAPSPLARSSPERTQTTALPLLPGFQDEPESGRRLSHPVPLIPGSSSPGPGGRGSLGGAAPYPHVPYSTSSYDDDFDLGTGGPRFPSPSIPLLSSSSDLDLRLGMGLGVSSSSTGRPTQMPMPTLSDFRRDGATTAGRRETLSWYQDEHDREMYDQVATAVRLGGSRSASPAPANAYAPPPWAAASGGSHTPPYSSQSYAGTSGADHASSLPMRLPHVLPLPFPEPSAESVSRTSSSTSSSPHSTPPAQRSPGPNTENDAYSGLARYTTSPLPISPTAGVFASTSQAGLTFESSGSSSSAGAGSSMSPLQREMTVHQKELEARHERDRLEQGLERDPPPGYTDGTERTS